MIIPSLRSVFAFVVDAHRERAKRYTDWRQESRRYDGFDNDALQGGLHGARFVKLGDVIQILDGIRARADMRFNDNDWDDYVTPVFNALKNKIERGQITCYLEAHEHILPDGRVRVADFAALLADFDLPDGAQSGAPRARDTITVSPDEKYAPATTRWEAWRQKCTAAFPLRTPSSDVVYKDIQAEHALNIRRPLIVALGLAHILRDQTVNITDGAIPTYMDTAPERHLKNHAPKPPRYFRGQRLD